MSADRPPGDAADPGDDDAGPRVTAFLCGDFLTDYEGIGGREEFRPGLSLLYLAALAPGGGAARLSIRPFRLRRFRLEEATGEEAAWLRETLDRESRPLGARVREGNEGTLEVSAATEG